MQETQKSSGFTLAVCSALVLAFTGIFISILTRSFSMPAAPLAFWRNCLVSVFLLLFLGRRRSLILSSWKKEGTFLVLYGLLLTCFNMSWTVSVGINGAAVATVLVYSSGAFTAVLGRFFLKEPLDALKLCAVAASFTGCLLVSGALGSGMEALDLTGLIPGALSGFCFGVYSIMGRSASQKGLHSWVTLWFAFTVAAIILLLVNMAPPIPFFGNKGMPGLLHLGANIEGWLVLLLLAVGPTLGGYGLYNMSLARLPGSIVNLIATLEPVFTALIAYYFLGEVLTGIQLTGGELVVAGVLLLRVRSIWAMRKNSRKKVTTSPVV